MPRTGRPKIDPKEKKSVFPLRLNEQERKMVESAAKKDKEKPSTWARKVLLDEASKRI